MRTAVPQLQQEGLVDKHFQTMVKQINYTNDLRFRDLDLLQACFIRAHAFNASGSIQKLNETLQHDLESTGGGGSLEFIGDAVLNFLAKVHRLNENIATNPHLLTTGSASLVSNQTLSEVFRHTIMKGLNPEKDLVHAISGEDNRMGRSENNKIYGDHMEAIFGAKYLER